MKNAILENAEGLVLCHNHPSGNLRPSVQDDRITRACREACETLQLRMLDHLIIAPQGYYSYLDESVCNGFVHFYDTLNAETYENDACIGGSLCRTGIYLSVLHIFQGISPQPTIRTRWNRSLKKP